jgi:hypothetical protein
MTSGQVFPSLTSTLGAVPPPATQLSVQARLKSAGTFDKHDTVISAGSGLNTGGIRSLTVISWVSTLELPHRSVAVHVLVNILGQLFPLLTVTAGADPEVPQLSNHARFGPGGGTCDIHDTVTLGGAEDPKTGGVLSLIRMFWVMSAVLPQLSVNL